MGLKPARALQIPDTESEQSDENDQGPHQPLAKPQGPKPKRGLTQSCIEDMRGVVDWQQRDNLGVPNTLYLGVEDVIRLRDQLSQAVSQDDLDVVIAVLKRLSAMPCTLQLLKRSEIGVTVGKLRKHTDASVSELSTRVVAVWKRQIAQAKSTKNRTAIVKTKRAGS